VKAMGGANTGRSNEEDEGNPPDELPNDAHRPHDTRPRSSQTTFRDRHPDVPPLADEPQRRTTQPPAAQAAQGKLLIDHGRRTDIRGRRPGLKVTPPPLRGVDRADNLAAQATQDCHPIHASNFFAPRNSCLTWSSRPPPRLASPPLGAAAPTSTATSTTEETRPSLNVSSPRRCLQEGNDVAAVIARSGTRSLGFLPESHNHRGCRRSSTASVSKKKNDAGAPPLPAPKRSVLGFRPEHLHATPRTGRPALLLPTATKHHRSPPARRPPVQGRSPGTSCPDTPTNQQAVAPQPDTPTNQQAVAPQAKTTGRASSLQHAATLPPVRRRRAAVLGMHRPNAPPPQHAADRGTTVPGQKRRQGPPPESRQSQLQAQVRSHDPALARQAQNEPKSSPSRRSAKTLPPSSSCDPPRRAGRLLLRLPQTWVQGRRPGLLFPAGGAPHAPASPVTRAPGPPHLLRR
jgi:hypothetical protein